MIKDQGVLDILRDIILKEMSLPDDRVNIYNSRYELPEDDNIFVVLEPFTSQVISNRSWTESGKVKKEEVLYENQELNTHETVKVGIFSRSLDALNRKEEVVMALYSNYSQQQQEENTFKIGRNMPIENLSDLEGSALLYRFEITVSVLAWYNKRKQIPFYDTLNVSVKINDGQPTLKKDFVQPLKQPS